MSQPQFPFQPMSGNVTTSVAAVTTSASQITLPIVSGNSLVPTEGCEARFTVDGNQRISWAYGNVPVNITTGTIMLANTIEVFHIPGGTTQISANAPASGSNLSITLGRGY